MAKPIVRKTTVTEVVQITPHLQRVVLQGEALKEIPADCAGAHAKVLLPTPAHAEPELSDFPVKRSYTLRTVDTDKGEVVIDFVINRHAGPGTDWAASAKAGDTLYIAGPGPIKFNNYDAADFMLIADITALPAIDAFINKLPQSASRQIHIVVPDSADQQLSAHTDQRGVHWHLEPIELDELLTTVSANGLTEDTKAFVGGEAAFVKEVRRFLLNSSPIQRSNLVTTGYWKQGADGQIFNEFKRVNPDYLDEQPR